nr:hypothetical protein [Gammaproteobacteria bacterium]
ASLLLSISNGAPLEAMSLYEQDYLSLRDRILEHLMRVYKNEVNPIAPVSEYLKEDLTTVVAAQQSIVMDVLRLQLGADSEFVINHDCIKQLTWMSEQSEQLALHNLRTYLLKAQQWLRGVTHLNPQLLIESLLIRWSHTRVKAGVAYAS